MADKAGLLLPPSSLRGSWLGLVGKNESEGSETSAQLAKQPSSLFESQRRDTEPEGLLIIMIILLLANAK